MAIRVTWPSESDQPYEITVVTGTTDHAEKRVLPGGEEFERFRGLVGKLVQVPKSELDEQLRENRH